MYNKFGKILIISPYTLHIKQSNLVLGYIKNTHKGALFKPMNKYFKNLWAGLLCLALTSSYSFSTLSKLTVDERVSKLVDKMTPEQKLGQMLILKNVSYNNIEAEELTETMKKIIKKYHPGGWTVCRPNLKNIQKSVEYIHDVQQTLITSNDLPAMITIDQEGGTVTKIENACSFPGNMALGALNNFDRTYQVGQIIGAELAAIGINHNYAPVVDINDNPQNPIINVRSFGSNPDLVKEMGKAFMDGLNSKNIISTAKHFPGHGNTNKDSHTGLPSIDKSLEDLKNFELIPFKYMIDNGTDCVMTSHIMFPNIDKTTYISKKDNSSINPPATLSKKILTDVLRNDLGFNGIIVTDSMCMQAIVDHFEMTEAIEIAIKSGANMICGPTTLSQDSDILEFDKIMENLKNKLSSDSEFKNKVEDSVKRIVKMKIKKGIIDSKTYATSLDSKIQTALKVVGCKEHRKIEREIARECITVYKNEKSIFPITPSKSDKVLFLSPSELVTLSVKKSLARLLEEAKIPEISSEFYNYTEQSSISNELQEKIDSSKYVILLTQHYAESFTDEFKWLSDFPSNITKLPNISNNLVLISIGVPYDIVNYPDASTILLAYCVRMNPSNWGDLKFSTENCPNIPAAIEACFGAGNPKGTIPVKLPNK